MSLCFHFVFIVFYLNVITSFCSFRWKEDLSRPFLVVSEWHRHHQVFTLYCELFLWYDVIFEWISWCGNGYVVSSKTRCCESTSWWCVRLRGRPLWSSFVFRVIFSRRCVVFSRNRLFWPDFRFVLCISKFYVQLKRWRRGLSGNGLYAWCCRCVGHFLTVARMIHGSVLSRIWMTETNVLCGCLSGFVFQTHGALWNTGSSSSRRCPVTRYASNSAQISKNMFNKTNRLLSLGVRSFAPSHKSVLLSSVSQALFACVWACV
jgi:hypothetical protein